MCLFVWEIEPNRLPLFFAENTVQSVCVSLAFGAAAPTLIPYCLPFRLNDCVVCCVLCAMQNISALGFVCRLVMAVRVPRC